MTTVDARPGQHRHGQHRAGGPAAVRPEADVTTVVQSSATPAAPAEVIVLDNLTKLYEPTPRWMRAFARTHIANPVRALDGVDLVVREGEICAVIGPNGAGKTTLFRIIVGLTTATAGSGTVLGLDVERQAEQVRQIVGWMPSEDRSLLMRATCRENLHLHGRLQGMRRPLLTERIDAMLEAVDLTTHADAVVASLSAGMKARLRLARALLPGPRALILDEPTGTVDPVAAHGLLELIMTLVERERLAVLISSHRLEEIEALRSRSLLLDRGRIKYAGDLDTLRTQWDTPQLELVFADDRGASRALHALELDGVTVHLDETGRTCLVDAAHGVGGVLVALGPLAADVVAVRESRLPLRDLIARVYRGGTS